MLLSTIGVWCLGPAVVIQGQGSVFYEIAIQFFLHFQFNGWFVIAVIALFFHQLQLQDSKQFRLFFKLLIISTVLTLALPVNWFVPSHFIIMDQWVRGFIAIGCISCVFKTDQTKTFICSVRQVKTYNSFVQFCNFLFCVKGCISVFVNCS